MRKDRICLHLIVENREGQRSGRLDYSCSALD